MFVHIFVRVVGSQVRDAVDDVTITLCKLVIFDNKQLWSSRVVSVGAWDGRTAVGWTPPIFTYRSLTLTYGSRCLRRSRTHSRYRRDRFER